MPLSLVYACEAVLPAEVSVPTTRYGLMTKQQNRDELFNDFDTIEQLWDAALVRMAAQQQIVARSLIRMSKLNRLSKVTGSEERYFRIRKNLMLVS